MTTEPADLPLDLVDRLLADLGTGMKMFVGRRREAEGDQTTSGGRREAEGDQTTSGGRREAEGDLATSGGRREAEGDQTTSGGRREAEGDLATSGGRREAEGDLATSGGRREAEGDLATSGGRREAEGDQTTSGGRREAEGDQTTFVVQTGEDGRHRLPLPDPDDPGSVVACAERLQAHLTQISSRPLPACPVEGHAHALRPVMSSDGLTWSCPQEAWSCAAGDYEDASWPRPDVDLAPALARRLQRRGLAGADDGFRTLAISHAEGRSVAVIGVPHVTRELIARIAEAAAPLEVEVHEDNRPPAWRC